MTKKNEEVAEQATQEQETKSRIVIELNEEKRISVDSNLSELGTIHLLADVIQLVVENTAMKQTAEKEEA